ncbi:spindle pole body component 110-like isoform X2 [Miscanthus floridulus]|uniref:spindle pole body component 110-like isoform X2 n=2 Tax=Miscanthus floridulus TaxID=154761 RepID=UPI003459D409
MDPLKAPIVATLLCLCFVRALCDAASASPSPEQEQEIQMLRSKVASLEDEISRRKEETSELESVVRERTAQMATLVGDLELLQVNLGDDESVMKANTHNAMLEKQIERLGNDWVDQIRKGESLEARVIEAERSLHEFGRKLEHAEKTNIEQKKKIQDLSDRLQYAQGKVSLLENEAKSKAEELAKAHGMWLPHWLAVRVLGCQVRLTHASD